MSQVATQPCSRIQHSERNSVVRYVSARERPSVVVPKPLCWWPFKRAILFLRSYRQPSKGWANIKGVKMFSYCYLESGKQAPTRIRQLLPLLCNDWIFFFKGK